MRAPSSLRLDRRTPGISATAFTIRFVLWMQGLREIPDPYRIVAHFNVSRATAYRWLQAWRDALGLPPLERPKKPKKPTLTEIKDALGYRAASGPFMCRACTHSHAQNNTWWLRCSRHEIWVRNQGTCDQFEVSEQKP